MQLAYPISLAVVASSISILIWVWFWTRKQDLNNEPLIFVFFGGVAAVLLALPFQKSLDILMPGSSPIVVTLWATVEEILKLSTVLCAIKFFKLDKEKIVVYMIISALGFVALENILFVVGPLIGENMTQGVITGNLRFIGASLLHIVASGIVGIGLSLSFYKSTKRKIFITAIALILAITIHTLFNLLLISGHELFVFPFSWVLALTFVYVVFEKNGKIPKKEMGIFVLIIILSISGGVYADAKLPKYTPEVLAAWQYALKDVETSQSSLEDKASDYDKSILRLDSIHSQLKSMLATMEGNRDLSIEEREFMENYDDLVNEYRDGLPKYAHGVLDSWQKQLERMERAYASFEGPDPRDFTESLAALNSIRSQLREVVKIMEENRTLSPEQEEFLSSYDAYVNQYTCILRKQETEDSTESCNL